MSDWYFCILRCADGNLYSGITADVERRIREHNQGTAGARYARPPTGQSGLVSTYRIAPRRCAVKAPAR